MQPQEYVGIDLHRRRSVIVRRSSEGETLEVSHVNNDDLLAFERAVTAAGEHPEVVLEAVRVVLGDRSARTARLQGPPRPSTRQQLGQQSGEKRRVNRTTGTAARLGD